MKENGGRAQENNTSTDRESGCLDNDRFGGAGMNWKNPIKI